jgi:hypothetical protein
LETGFLVELEANRFSTGTIPSFPGKNLVSKSETGLTDGSIPAGISDGIGL